MSDFLIRCLLEIIHDDDQPQHVGQSVQGRLQSLGIDRIVGRRGRGLLQIEIQIGGGDRALAAQAFQKAGTQNSEQPTGGPLGVAQLIEVTLGDQVRLLGQILGIGDRAGQPVGVPVDRLVMAIDQFDDLLGGNDGPRRDRIVRWGAIVGKVIVFCHAEIRPYKG